ncbi:MAG: hypothetical protein P9E24_05530 [Candidatus Competibacter sp.]|nr:hypothetical protein [Candidatus Competibacter sp.]MDG4585584.1 hypothetical protein [Candidatus Competibacter sp.]
MATPARTDQETPPLWRYVPIADYRVPAATVEHTVKTGLCALWRHFQPKPAQPQSPPLKTEDELRAVPEARIARIVPAPDWQPAAAALDETLAGWLDSKQPASACIFVVSPPHGGNGDILTAWAANRGWRVISPPSPEQILACDPAWLADWTRDQIPWVLPNLERCYLRHARGLDLARRLLDHACAGSPGRGVIGCDSWAWAFLRRAWRGPEPPLLTLQGFDSQGLTRWFQSFIAGSGMDRLVFRQADNGKYVLPSSASTVEDEPIETSDFLSILAAHSRGIPGIAHAIWRANLRTAPDRTLSEVAENEDPTGGRSTIWVTPWRQIRQTTPASDLLRKHAALLHTLLLHTGLTAGLLGQLLPLATPPVEAALACLEAIGLVARCENQWWISPASYPTVRQFLRDDGYLIDGF